MSRKCRYLPIIHITFIILCAIPWGTVVHDAWATGRFSALSTVPKEPSEPRQWQINGARAALDDQNLRVRQYAIDFLADADGFESIIADKVETILPLLEAQKSTIRVSVLATLSKLGDDCKGCKPKIARLLKDTSGYVRGLAVQALGRHSHLEDTYIRQIAQCINDPNINTRYIAIDALVEQGERARDYIPQIAKLIETTDTEKRSMAIQAICRMGELSKDYIPLVAELLDSPNAMFRNEAIHALTQWGSLSKDQIPRIVDLLEDPVDYVCIAAMDALRSFGELSRDHIPRIAALIEASDDLVRDSAVRTLAQMGEMSKDYYPQMARLLNEPDSSIRISAINAMRQMGEPLKDNIARIAAMLKEPDSMVRTTALNSLSTLGALSEDHIATIAALIKDPDSSVRMSTASTLARLKGYPTEYHPLIAELLNDQIAMIRSQAIQLLGQLGEKSSLYVPRIAELLNDPDMSVRNSAISFLGKLKSHAKDFIPQITEMLKVSDNSVGYYAVDFLGKQGESSKACIPQISQMLLNSNPEFRRAAMVALTQIGEVDIQLYPHILAPIYSYPSESHQFRFLAHFVGGGKEDLETVLKWVGEPRANRPRKLGHREARKTLQTFNAIWDATAPFEKLRLDLARQIATVIAQRGMSWTRDDLDVLVPHQNNLRHFTHARIVDERIGAIKTKTWSAYLIRLWGAHACFWLILVFAYPRSSVIQAIFFWNPWFRKIMGLGYINFALTWIPYLRQKLFAPFRESLIADAGLDYFDDESYFGDCRILGDDDCEPLPILEAIPAVKGQIVIEGESGLGKTMFIRRLLKRSKRVAVYLPAEKCSAGVMESIQAKLHGVARDKKFIRNLIHSGAIDIFIDGLNEVSAETRANLTQFVETFFRGNVIIATQPMEWRTPSTASRYVLQPLGNDQIEAYLVSRRKTISKESGAAPKDYETVCRDYIRGALGQDQPAEVLSAAQNILSNPMDLAVVARMLATGMEPDLYRLQEQQYRIMAADYEQRHASRQFPLKSFSELVFQMRLNDVSSIPTENYIEEIRCMGRHKMVLSRQSVDVEGNPTKDRFFRHDKVMDFFIVQSFLDHNDRPLEHIGDPRFRGVYFLLANLLPWDAAMALREELINYAADTKDVSVSHKFVKLIRERKILKAA